MPETTTTETGTASPEDTGSDQSLAWGTTAFDPGSDVALVARNTVGLIERDNPSTRARLWSLVSTDAPVDDILDELSSTGLKALPDFGLAQVEGTAVRIVARGRTTISAVLGSGSTHEIDPSGVRTWIEELVHDVAAITITLAALDGDGPAESGEAFAVLAGSVPASSLTRWYDAPDDHAEAAESGSGWTAVGAASTAGDTNADVATDADAGVDEAEVSNERDAVLTAAEVERTDDEPESVSDVELEMMADVDEPANASGDSPVDDGADDDGADDGAVIIPPQPTADTDTDIDTDIDTDVDTHSDQPEPAVDDDRTADPVGDESVPGGPPLVDARPASPQPPPPAVQPPGPPPSGPGAGGAPPAPPDPTIVVGPEDGPTRGPVTSIFDPDFDDFDDHAAGSVPGDAANPLLDTTAHAVLVFSNGERIEVDRAVLIGRNPKVAGAIDGHLPHIMKYDGPGQGLSRTHAEVRIEAGDVLVEDLESTNGTEVQLPGQQRRRLVGGEPVVIVPGTLIDFGDELHCTLESPG